MRGKWRWFIALGVVLFALLVWRGSGGTRIESGSLLVITLEGAYPEGVSNPLLSLLDAGSPSFVAELSRLRKAQRDERIETVLLRLRDLQLGWGRVEELRNTIKVLGESGKNTIALLEQEGFGDNAAYYLASATQRVVITPAAHNPFVGLAGESLYLGGLFEKIGVKVDYERIGRYKSAAESYAETGPSDATREMDEALFDSINAIFVQNIASARGMSPDALRALIDTGPTTPEELRDAGLVDAIAWYDEVLDELGDPPRVSAGRYDEVEFADLDFSPEAQFALVYGVGPVVTGQGNAYSNNPALAADTVVKNLKRAAKDDDIEAIVFRVNSPGGSPLASDLVWRAIHAIEKPVVVSMSDLAASGGYYVASAADRIVSQPGTLTGSIGVFALRPYFGGLYQKLGLGTSPVTRGARADLLLSGEPLSDAARDVLKRQIDSIYEKFLARVESGRELERDAIDAVGRGRVWTGAQALEHGLVDELGGLHEAVLAGKKLAGLDAEVDVALIEYAASEDFFEQLLDLVALGVRSQLGLAQIPAPLGQMARTLAHFESGQPLLLPAAWLEIR